MKVNFLGTGTMGSSRKNTSFVINNHVLVDIGNGALNALRDCGLDTIDINTMLITHFHCDHFGDIINYLWRFKVKHITGKEDLICKDHRLKIIGPIGLKDKVRQLKELFFPKPDLDYIEMLSSHIEFIELDYNESFQNEKLRVEAFEVNHVGQCNGYLIEIDDKKLVYTGDTAMCDSLIVKIAEAYSIIIEAGTISEPVKGHINLNEVIPLAKQWKDKNFYIVHRRDWNNPIGIENMFFPNDGESIVI